MHELDFKVKNSMIQISKVCSFNKKEYSVYLTPSQYRQLMNNDSDLIEKVCSHMTEEEKEFLYSGRTPNEQQTLVLQ
jgi:hypothetical protein